MAINIMKITDKPTSGSLYENAHVLVTQTVPKETGAVHDVSRVPVEDFAEEIGARSVPWMMDQIAGVEIVPYEYEWTEGGYVSLDDGSIVEYTGWMHTGFVEVGDTRAITTETEAPDNRQYNAFYDENEEFICTFSSGGTVRVPDGAKYFRLSCNHNFPVEAGMPKYRVRRMEKTESYTWTGSLAASATHDTQLSFAPKLGFVATVRCEFESFDALTLLFDQYSPNSITIDNSQLILRSRLNPNDIVMHGLTLNKALTLVVAIEKPESYRITLESQGVSRTFEFTNRHFTCYENIRLVNGSAALENIKLTLGCGSINRNVWLFGDSYFTANSPMRWTYYAIQNGYTQNALYCGATGATTTEGLKWLDSLMTMGTPKTIVWCIGMSDRPDSNGVPAWDWLAGVQTLIEICKVNEIELILATAPTIPSKNHEAKNAWVRAAGYRYIDFAEAVGAQADGTWNDEMLDDDNQHPSELGAKALYFAAVNAVPEITEVVTESDRTLREDISQLQNDVKAMQGISFDRSDVLFRSEEEIVSGTGTYVHRTVYTYDGAIAAGDVYTIGAKRVQGPTIAAPYAVELYSGDTRVRVEYDDSVTILDSDISAEVDSIQFLLYPARGDAMAAADGSRAVYTDVMVVKGTDGGVKAGGDLRDAVGNLLALPAEVPAYYYVNGYLEGKVRQINGLLKEADDSFMFITDAHWDSNMKNSLPLIRYIAGHCAIPRLFEGGDTGDGASEAYCAALRGAFSRRVYHIAGNHDWYNGCDGRAMYAMMDAVNNDQAGNPERHFYYVDNLQQRIRYIVLNAYKAGDAADYDAAQVSWFTDTALNVPGDWDILVFTHYIGMTEIMTGASGIVSAIDAFNAESGRNGKVLAIIQGHMHSDAVNHTTGGTPIVTTTCDKCGAWSLNGVNQESYLTATRKPGTITEQAFDVVALKRTVSGETRTVILTLVRIGAPAMDNVDKDFYAETFVKTGTLQTRTISASYAYNAALSVSGMATPETADLDKKISEAQGEVTDLKSQISNVENLTPNEMLFGTYSGTRYTTVNNLSIPAGTYRLTVDSVTSTDTDKTTCRVEFENGSTDVLVLQLDRNVPIDMEITLDSQVTNISFYASSIYAYTANDTFAFNDFAISDKYALLTKIDTIENDISELESAENKCNSQIKNINDALKFYEETYTVKASTEHSSTDDMLTVFVPSGSLYRIQFDSPSVISNDINVKAYYSDNTNEYVKTGCHVPSINSLTASKDIVAFGFWSSSSFSSANVDINVKAYVDGSVLDVYQKIDWDETPVLNDFQIKTLKVFDSFTLNQRSYSFSAGANITNYNNYATTSSVAYNTPPVKIRNKDGTLIYNNLHVTPKDASTYAAWTFDIDGNFLRGVTFSAMGSRQTPFLADEYYAILNEYPTTSGYTDTHWYVSNIDIEWLNGKNEYIVGSGGDFTTFTEMLIALENDSSEKTVYVKGGTYDIFTEMGGAEYIASIAPSVADLNWRDVCHVVPPNTTIIGLGNVDLLWQPTAEQMISESVAFLFSPLNTSGTCHIENISVVARNCRYVVHDETSGLAQYNGAKHYYKNCRFTLLSGSYGFILYGAGHNKLMDIRFDDCVFDSQNASMIWSTHDWGTAVNDNSVFVFNNCVFTSTIANPYVRFSSTDSVGRLDKVMFNNCYLQKIKFVTTSGSNAKQGYDVQLVGCSPVEVEYDEHVTDRVAVRQYNPIPQST